MLGLEVLNLQMENGAGLMDRSGELSSTGGNPMSQTTSGATRIALSSTGVAEACGMMDDLGPDFPTSVNILIWTNSVQGHLKCCFLLFVF